VTHWTQVLSDVSLVEFVLLAALTALQWIRHRIPGAGWVALSFAILGGLALTIKIDPTLVTHQNVAAKALVALLLLMPYCLFRFAATFRRPSRVVRSLAAGVTIAIVAFTFALDFLPAPGAPPPPDFIAYRVAFAVAFGFLFAYVVICLSVAGRGEPPIASSRMRLLAVAVAGLQVQVVVAALGLQGPTVTLATEALTVAMGVLFLVALVLPSFVRVFLSRKADLAFRRAVSELVSAGDSRDVAEHLLPHVCALVGASEAALLAGDGTLVARYPVWSDSEGPDPWRGDPDPDHWPQRRITVRTHSGTTHTLAVKISSYMPYFGSDELHKLEQLADMVGLAIERCEMAEQMAYQASHDGLTGLANRSLFMERLEESLSHVGRRRAGLAVMFIDLDRFKLVNDRADHSAGDVILNEMADRLTRMTRGVDVVARFGGDEFVAFAEVDNEADALDMAERIRKGLSAPVTIGEAHLVVTASIGIVVTDDSSAAPAMLLRDADNAMYDAKRSGRDQTVLHRTNARDVANLKWGLSPTRAARLNAS
jgi:diguanylate cyclase (GGDEF)-like protein